MKRYRKYCFLFIIIIMILLLATSVVSANSNNTDSDEIDDIHSISKNINNNLITKNSKTINSTTTEYESEYEDIKDSQIVDDELLVNQSLKDKKNLKLDKYPIIYVSNDGEYNSTGDSSDSPTTITNALNHVEDGGSIYLITNRSSDKYILNSSLSLSHVSSISIIGESGKNITLESSKSELLHLYDTSLNISNINFVNKHSTSSAIYVYDSDIKINNCSFISNKRNNYSSCIYALSSNVTINNTNFTNNTGVYGIIYSSSESNIIITNSLFEYNKAKLGGVIYAKNSYCKITGSKFRYNNASYAGCIYLYNTKLESANNLFESNTAKYYGGAIVCLDNQTVNIKTSNFTSNNAQTAGAIYSLYTNITISDSVFELNHADSAECVFSYNNTLNIQKSALVNNLSGNSLVELIAVKKYNLNNNWWGVNNPDFNTLTNSYIANNWLLMRLYNQNNTVNITLNELSDGSKINTSIKRLVNMTESNKKSTLFNIKNNITKNYTCNKSELLIKIDNEEMDLNSKIIPSILSSNIICKQKSTINININANKDISGDITIYLDKKIIGLIKAKKVCNYSYELPSSIKSGEYTIDITYNGNSKYNKTTVIYNLTVQSSTYDNTNNITPVRTYTTSQISLPHYYNLVDLNQTTPVKRQGSSGSCITFASMAALESSIKKKTNLTYDFSENNLKNMFKRFSVIGFPDLTPNEGGYDLEPVGYMVSGYGPVLESDDEYDTESVLSTKMQSTVQVQNVYFVPHRQNFTDNNLIKEAIMKYGGVFTSIKSSSKLNILSNSTTADHVVCIVGWDDYYSKSNFSPQADGDGAFIIKNSWGKDVGNNGYQYVSYYDTVIGDLIYPDSYNDINFAIDYNNLYNYSSIYQYDSVCYVYKIKDTGKGYSIKNIYTMNNSQVISAVGTYFVNTSNYTIKVYINDNLVTTKKGSADYPGYRTIYLDKFFRVNENDEVIVTIDIMQNMDNNYIYVPLQDNDYPIYSKANISYISYDKQKTWEDLYTSDDDYFTAPIKVYMMDLPRVKSSLNYSNDTINIQTEVLNLNGSAKVYYMLNGEYLYDKNNKIISKTVTKSQNISIQNSTKGLNNGKYTLETVVVYDGINITCNNYFTVKNKNITLKAGNITAIINQTVKLDVTVSDNNNQTNKINEGTITVSYANNTVISTAKLSNNKATINLNNTKSGNYTLNVLYSNATNYEDIYQKIVFTVNKIPTTITALANNTHVFNTTKITGKLLDKNSKPVSSATINIKINNNTYTAKTNNNGEYTYNYKNTIVAKNNITVTYNTSSYYEESSKSITYNTWKLPTAITASTQNTYVYNTSKINGTLKDYYNKTIANAQIKITINNNTYYTTTNSKGEYSYEYKNPIVAKNNVTVSFESTDTYNNIAKSFTYTTSILSSKITLTKINGTIGEKITLKANITDNFNNPVKSGYVIFKINSVTVKDNGQINGSNNALKVYVKNGIAQTDIIAYLNVRYGQNLTAVYSGTSCYEASRSNTAKIDIVLRQAQIVVKCNVSKAKQDTYIKFTATIYDITSGKRSSVIHNLSEQYVYFKVNGITIKNSDGTVYQTKVVNGVATYNYKIPKGFMAITDAKTFNPKNHNVTAGLYNKNYYPTVVNYTSFQVERSIVKIDVVNAVINNKTHKLSLNATMKDYNNNYLVGSSKIIVKINGLTICDSKNKVIYFMITDGKIQLKDINIPQAKKYTTITIVTHDRLGYQSARATSSKITVKN